MPDHRRLSELSREELLARAAAYRQMAIEARTADVRDALQRIAERLRVMAEARSACASSANGKDIVGRHGPG